MTMPRPADPNHPTLAEIVAMQGARNEMYDHLTAHARNAERGRRYAPKSRNLEHLMAQVVEEQEAYDAYVLEVQAARQAYDGTPIPPRRVCTCPPASHESKHEVGCPITTA